MMIVMTSSANNSGLKPTLMEISWRWNIPRLRNEAVGGFITPGNPPFVFLMKQSLTRNGWNLENGHVLKPEAPNHGNFWDGDKPWDLSGVLFVWPNPNVNGF
jgi:hypothetical protein